MGINPTLGRVVWYKNEDGDVFAAIIVAVHSEDLVNLAVFDDCGLPFSALTVPVFQGDSGEYGEKIPVNNCGWTPYQKIAAAKNANDTNLDEWHEPNKSK